MFAALRKFFAPPPWTRLPLLPPPPGMRWCLGLDDQWTLVMIEPLHTWEMGTGFYAASGTTISRTEPLPRKRKRKSKAKRKH